MKNKKKVGIITYHRSYNYGTVLQAYATAKTVYNLGYQVEIIDFENKYDKNVYKTFYWNNKKMLNLM